MSKKDLPKKHYLRKAILFSILAIALITIYARYIGTKGLDVREYVITDNSLTSNFDGLKIIHFSDLHYGTTMFLSEVEKLIKEINNLKPDIVIFTGDLIDIHYNISDHDLEKLISALNKLNPAIDSFLVRGNHDQSESYATFLEKTNFNILNNRHELFYYHGETPLLIVGLDDKYAGTLNPSLAFPEEANEYYTIVLAHQPDIIKELSNYKIDLYFAGHSHGGQIRLPFIGAVVKNQGAKLYYDEEYQIGNTRMFISNGLGTSQIPFRLLNKPSISLYRFFAQ